MLTAVEFDHELCLETHEIDDVVADRRLSAEFDVVKPSVAYFLPELVFRLCKLATHGTRETAVLCGDGLMRHPSSYRYRPARRRARSRASSPLARPLIRPSGIAA